MSVIPNGLTMSFGAKSIGSRRGLSDLTAQDGTGNYTHSIVQLLDNAEYHFDTGRYFV